MIKNILINFITIFRILKINYFINLIIKIFSIIFNYYYKKIIYQYELFNIIF